MVSLLAILSFFAVDSTSLIFTLDIQLQFPKDITLLSFKYMFNNLLLWYRLADFFWECEKLGKIRSAFVYNCNRKTIVHLIVGGGERGHLIDD